MTGIFQQVADAILRVPAPLALTLVFLLPALEASIFVGFVVPGEIGVLLGGVLANQHKVSLGAVLACGIAGAVIGDSVGYEVGRAWGATLLLKLPDRLIDEDRLARATAFIRRLGGRAVFVGRFTTALRVLVPGLAGMSRLPYPRFLAFNVAGGAVWATAFVLLGYAVGSQYGLVERNATYVGLAVLALVAGLLVGHHLRRRRDGRDGPRPDAADTRAGRGGAPPGR